MIFGNKERILYGNRFNGTNGNGYQPINKGQTNEEWFDSLQSSDKAKYIAKAMYFYDMGMPMGEALRASIRHEQGLNRTLEDDVIKWLKQPHTKGVAE